MTWKLVPVEPTREMVEAGWAELTHGRGNVYTAMLAAAPQPVIDDAMVERAARAMARLRIMGWPDMVEAYENDMWHHHKHDARAALTAALGGQDE